MFYICENFFEYSRLYTYIIIACKFEIVDLYTYFYFIYLIRSYRKTYQSLIKPVLIEDLALDPDILLLKLYKLCRQPKIKRIKKNVWKR